MFGNVSDIDLRYLRVFVAVVQSGGFSLAAARLNVADSTVSAHMSDLEQRLGIRLCERGRGGFRLTRSGEEVYEATIDLLDHLDSYRDRIASVSTRIGASFAIAIPDAIETFSELPIGRWIDRLADAYPELHIELRVLDPRSQERQVVEEQVAAAFAPEHRRVAGLAYEPLAGELNLLYCGRAHPLFSTPDEAITDAMLEHAGLISRGYIEHFDAVFFRNPEHRATVHQIEAATMLIETGKFVGFLPSHFVEERVARGAMRALKPDTIRLEVPFSLITKKGIKPDPVLLEFRRIVLGGSTGKARPDTAKQAAQ